MHTSSHTLRIYKKITIAHNIPFNYVNVHCEKVVLIGHFTKRAGIVSTLNFKLFFKQHFQIYITLFAIR